MYFFQTIEYGRPLYILPGVRLTFHDAAHILGSALISLEISEKNGGIEKRGKVKDKQAAEPNDKQNDDSNPYHVTTLVFTGDGGRKGATVVRDPEIINRTDVFITESTYGGRHQGPMAEVRETAEKRGMLITPAFAVGRTQDIIYNLRQLMESKQIPTLSVYVDPPLATDVTEIFREHPECFDEEMQKTPP